MSYRIRNLERHLEEQQVILQGNDAHRHRHAELESERLETLIENAKADEEIRERNARERRAAEDAKTQARQEAEQAALEAELRRRYDLAMPKPVTDAEWSQVKDAVFHKHRLKQMDAFDQQVAETRRRYGSML